MSLQGYKHQYINFPLWNNFYNINMTHYYLKVKPKSFYIELEATFQYFRKKTHLHVFLHAYKHHFEIQAKVLRYP